VDTFSEFKLMPTITKQQAVPSGAAAGEAYTSEFYDTIRNGSFRSAQAIVPIILELTNAKSVVDAGCGDGTWLSVFHKFGVTDTLGLDGEYVNREQLRIPQDQFRPTNVSRPFTVERRFDLAVSLEVAEHLPADSADGFVRSLTALAPVVMFSAAIPFQGGTDHLNEQWPDYWAHLFHHHDYVPIDCIRDRVWHNQEVEFWYVQNCLVFADRAFVEKNEVLRAAWEATNPTQLRKVHPRGYLRATEPLMHISEIDEAWGDLTLAFRRAARKRAKALLSPIVHRPSASSAKP
jgi:hypothetical protein